jgi:hypothetical protein
MDMNQALRVHAQLAHVLLPFWDAFPQIQQVVSIELGLWRDMQVTDEQFFDKIIERIRDIGLTDQNLLAAVAGAADEPVRDHLTYMFNEALACAERLYSRYSKWSGGAALFDDVGNQNSIYPEKVLGAFGVSGKTRPGRPEADAAVTLHLVPQLLGPPSWASIPYVLCHELVCHASQAGSSSEVTDPFIEGWMDNLAAMVSSRRRTDLFPWRPGAAADEGQRLCMALRSLYEDLEYLQRQARSARVQGAAAARIAQGILRDLAPLSPPRGRRSLFQRLSVELNAVEAASAQEYLAVHQRFIANVISGEHNPVAGVHRNALFREWVTRRASARQVLYDM